MIRRIIITIALAILVGLLGVTVHTFQQKIDANRDITFVDKKPVFLPKGETLKWLSMGYRGLMADALWIRCVLYYGRRVMDHDNPYFVYAEKHGTLKGEVGEEVYERHQARHHPDKHKRSSDDASVTDLSEVLKDHLFRGESQGLVDHIYPLLDRVTTVDPHFIFPYLFGGVYVLMDTGEIDAAYNLLLKGYNANPDRWEFPFYLGWLEWMYRGNMDETLTYLSEAIQKENCKLFVGRLYVGLSKKLDRQAITREYLKGLWESTDNPELRERMESLLQKLEEVSVQ